MIKMKIYGAGSIGNHQAYAARSMGWDVLICDNDIMALERTKNDIYPGRYGAWDNDIQLSLVKDLPNEEYDVVSIGTPPDSHLEIACHVVENDKPIVLLVEKPFCGPSLNKAQSFYELAARSGTEVLVGYNHVLCKNTLEAERIIKSGAIGECLTIYSGFLEYWGGIFNAHPWLNGPKDSYLGFYKRGGGASGEHSHAINIWQHFAGATNIGRIKEVSAMLDIVDHGGVEYDRICQLNVKTEKGIVGSIVQDVVTEPSKKQLRIQGTNGFLEWHVNWNNGNDAIFYSDGQGGVKENFIPKTRPDDFMGEMRHVQDVIAGKVGESPISLKRGLETMLVIAAAHASYKLKKSVEINYGAGFCQGAIIH